MILKWLSVAILLVGVMALGLAGVAQRAPTEAPAGFDTPTLAQNPGSQSISNGVAQPPGDTYALDQTRFEQDHDASPDWAQYLMPELAPIVIRIRSAADQASLPRFVRATTMPMAISSPRQSPSTTAQTP
jgi:hypothetical protein